MLWGENHEAVKWAGGRLIPVPPGTENVGKCPTNAREGGMGTAGSD